MGWQFTPPMLTGAPTAGGDESARAVAVTSTLRKIEAAAIDAARRG